jgi:Transposase DDE domain
LEQVRSQLSSQQFLVAHRRDSQAFSRRRKLSFEWVILLILQKSLKSMQLVLNEFFQKLSVPFVSAGASALTKARQKLSYTAFIALNREAVVDVYYSDGNYRTWQGHRVLGIDGSRIFLPDTPAIRQEFGSIAYANQLPETSGSLPQALASVCYDVLNGIALDSILAPAKSYEVDLALQHLEWTRPEDLMIFDRGYPSYAFLAKLLAQGRHFLARCSQGSFKEVQKLFQNPLPSQVVTLHAPAHQRASMKALGLPLQIQVRLITVWLKTGEVEVLVTSLRDEARYPASAFGQLYSLRWGIETFYGTLKGRLNLENFTGKSVQAVKQDFYSTIFISGVESILTQEAQEHLEQKTAHRHPQRVNQAVSFNTIKNRVLDLFYQNIDLDLLLEELTQLFLTNPVCQRNQRTVPRKKAKESKLIQYHKRIKKICF